MILRNSRLLMVLVAMPAMFLQSAISCAQEKELEGHFKFYTFYASKSQAERLRDIHEADWAADMTPDDRKALIAFLESEQSPFALYALSQILKADLDMDGQDEFVLTAVIKNPTRFRYGAVVAILQISGSDFRLLFAFPAETFAVRWNLAVVDFDSDGFKDIVVHKEVEAYGEVPPIDASIYKNNRMKDFTEVYAKAVHDYLQFVDLDNDARLELLEPVLAVQRKGLIARPPKLWINIYEWTGKEFVDKSRKYLDFYRKKEAEYRELLSKYRKDKSMIGPDMVGIYEEYLKRIADLNSSRK